MPLQEGIVYGNYTDVCKECIKDNIAGKLEKQPQYGDLEYKEVFKVQCRGDSICYCMKHFEQMLGKYTLIDPSTLEIDEEIDIQIEKECYNENIKQSEEQIVEEPKTKKTTRKTKKKEVDNDDGKTA